LSTHSITDFIERTAQKERDGDAFERETERLLEIHVDGMVWTKMGSMVAYRGGLKFTREGVLEHGFGMALKKAFSGEGVALTKVEGAGRLYLADGGKKVSILRLSGDSIYVNGNDVLAFEPSVEWDVKMMKKVSAMMSGGLFNMKLSGHGLIAITTHYEPITLLVKPGEPVLTDPNATVAWSGNLSPNFKTDISLKTLLGRQSGESFQMEFVGDGFVVIQPYEEVVAAPAR